MSNINTLKKDELAELAEFYAVEVEANGDNGPTKAEILAALNEDDVKWEDYERFKTAKETGQDKSQEVREEEALAKELEEAEADEKGEDDADGSEEEEEEARPSEPTLVVKMERQNHRYDIYGYTFTKDHPYVPVPESVADKLVTGDEGFRLASPSEVANYYN